MADDITDHENGRVVGALGDQVEVAADALGARGQECRGQVESRAVGKRRRRQRIADGAQIVAFAFSLLEIVL